MEARGAMKGLNIWMLTLALVLMVSQTALGSDLEITPADDFEPLGSGVSYDYGAIEEGIDADVNDNTAFVPDEIIVKFKKDAAEIVAVEASKNKRIYDLQISNSLDQLNDKHKAWEIKPLFKNFKRNRQRINSLLNKDKTLLTKREKHILKRLSRAPKGAKIPALERIYKIKLSAGQSARQAVKEYSQDPDVEYAELNYIVSIDLTPNDPLYSIQWALNNTGQMYPESGRYNHPPGTVDCDIDAPEAWDVNTGSSEVVVAVVDTGVDYTHRDLQNNMWINEAEFNGATGVDDDDNGYKDDIYGFDFTPGYHPIWGDPLDDHGHGTHCSGIIAAEGNNGLDIAGTCWNAKIMALKFLDSDGRGSTGNAVNAFYYAVDNGADIASNSWGGGDYSQSMQDAIDYAYGQGVIMVAAAGNNDSSSTYYPACYDHMIAVAATNSNDEKAGFSTYGDWVDIAAPGVDILSLRASGTSMSTTYDDYTTIASGTSMSCPYIAGVVGLIIAQYPDSPIDEVTARLLATADDISTQNPGYEGLLGSGRVNTYKAVRNGFEGVVTFGRDFYSCDDVLSIELVDFDLIGEPNQQVTIVTVGGDAEVVTLISDVNTPWIFAGSIYTSADSVTVGDGVLQVSDGEIVTVSYYDDNSGEGSPATVEAIATIDCQGPVIFEVQVKIITSSGAMVTFKTNEPGTGYIRCGLACGGPYTIIGEDITLANTHTVYLSGLASETEYYFVVDANDVVGNPSTNDNSGLCYSFTTTAPPAGLHVPGEYLTIQAAIDAAIDGNTIWVADGVYTGEGNRDIDFNGKAISVRNENRPQNCIIDCQDQGRGFYFHSGEGKNSILDGFTITNGRTYDNPFGYGGGIACNNNSGPTIRNCILTGNRASNSGGGICGNSYSNPTVSNCVISNNSAEYSGGGIFGGGMFVNCVVTGNSADKYGGGVCGFGPSSSASFFNCIIRNNFNYGLVFWEAGPMLVANCTIVENQYGFFIRKGATEIINSIIRDTIYTYQRFGEPDVFVAYSNIRDGWEGEGNIKAGPLFVTGPGGDYYLSQVAAGQASDSPCVDAGSDTAAYYLGLNMLTTRTDWIYDTGTVDMGYHYGDNYLLPTGEQCDIDGDGDVDLFDLSIMANQWQQAPGVPSADITPVGGDVMVNINDLASLIDHWLFRARLPADVDRPFAWWKFEEGAGTDANDSAGSNDGTLVGNPYWVTGKIGSWALDFNGVDDYVALPDNDPIWLPQDDFTVSCWVYFNGDASVTEEALVDLNCGRSSVGGRRLGYMVDRLPTGTIRFYMITGYGKRDELVSASVIPGGSWYHIAAVREGTTQSIYINGSLDNDRTCSAAAIDFTGGYDDDTVNVGGFMSNGNPIQQTLNGQLDDIRIYDGALTRGDIKLLYEGYKAFEPDPADGATGVLANVELNWQADRDMVSYDVYLGTDFDDVNDADTDDAGIYKGNVDITNFNPGGLDYETMYFWRIDEVADSNMYKGDVWSFTTLFPPGQATNPSPADLAVSVSMTADLSWTAAVGADNYDVYFGTTSPGAYQGNQTATTFDPGTMDIGTTYYWRIDPTNEAGTTTGDIWSFTTLTVPGQATNPSPADLATNVSTYTNLSWTASVGADNYDVYFGTTSPGAYQGNQTATMFDPGPMDANTTYYWRIDPNNVVGITTGNLWSFTTREGLDPSDPNLMAGWWKFDEGSGTDANDSAGGNDGVLNGSPGPTWVSGKIGSWALDFDGVDDSVRVDDDPNFDFAAGEDFSVSMWIKTGSAGYQYVLEKHNPIEQCGYRVLLYLGELQFITSSSGLPTAMAKHSGGYDDGQWHHVVGVRDQSAGKIYLYVDGSEVVNVNESSGTLANSAHLYIGSSNSSYYFDGTVDDVRIHDVVLSAGEIQQLYAAAYEGKAFNPEPAEGATGVDPNAVLSWQPGKDAVSHDVYLGTTFDDVNDANTADAGIYKDNVGVTSFDPCGLAFETTYFWRIDEVGASDTYKGDVWSFTTWAEFDPNLNLVSWWEFDEGTGTDANDSAGSKDGTLVGEPNWVAPGKIGSWALDFNGVEDYVALPLNNPIWLPQNDFTVSCWVYFNGAASAPEEALVDLNCGRSSAASNRLGYMVDRLPAGTIRFYMITGSGTLDELVSASVIPGGSWYHIVAVREATTQSIYINGSLDNDRTCSASPIDFTGAYDDDTVNVGGFGSNGVSGKQTLNGQLDDVRIYNWALSGAEVWQLYQSDNE